MMPYISKNAVIIGRDRKFITDNVTVEEPLQISIENENRIYNVSIIMRTPVDDEALATGFLVNEGIIEPDKIIKVSKRSENNVCVSVESFNEDLLKNRNFYVNSSCGVCGKTDIENVFIKSHGIVRSQSRTDHSIILGLPDKMMKNQKIFSYTGGIHAAALFDLNGNMISISEDIGRHNAVDKTIGKMILKNVYRMEDSILQVSGRAGFEILQKASMFGVSIVSSVSAPSSLAIDVAETFNITLISFVRKNRMNIYSHPERIL
ncbi:formate dehydrogenase accessory sulfurtransferase FdhD [Picrophilus oshimae]|uniref:Sulfur carrier protein FdhD n=1 Tax=Picrophilus torridus (strain ATCC 700027 / DSM 9790 / JCM 10055 / NBRC 100828 / KAW 2/3) TaxID=1122961 RepID=A0A8G2FXE5_PICTO|nr:formate dehydrogenase accessory sulfurtransferase FdhD [Picrophilus oshimae]SMD31250.1 FdhD protein [Picrophilus oshimae DSM 9789]